MSIKVIIPVKNLSIGLPGKNFKKVGGIPLYERSLQHSIKLRSLIPLEIYLSTDNPEILNKDFKIEGLNILDRDKSLCQPNSLTIDVVLDIIKTYKFKEDDIAILFQPTTPFRDIELVWKNIEFLKSNNYFKSIISLSNVGNNHPFKMKRITNNSEAVDYIDVGNLNTSLRQFLPETYILSGSFYISRVKDILNTQNLLPKPTAGVIHKSFEETINIDCEPDLILANHYAEITKLI